MSNKTKPFTIDLQFKSLSMPNTSHSAMSPLNDYSHIRWFIMD